MGNTQVASNIGDTLAVQTLINAGATTQRRNAESDTSYGTVKANVGESSQVNQASDTRDDPSSGLDGIDSGTRSGEVLECDV